MLAAYCAAAMKPLLFLTTVALSISVGCGNSDDLLAGGWVGGKSEQGSSWCKDPTVVAPPYQDGQVVYPVWLVSQNNKCLSGAGGSLPFQGRQVVLADCESANSSQKWRLDRERGETIAIQPDNRSKRCITVWGASEGTSKDDGTMIVDLDCQRYFTQKWKFKAIDNPHDDWYWIESVHSGKCIGVEQTNWGEQPLQSTCTDVNRQAWQVISCR